jgi:hypothetical protein
MKPQSRVLHRNDRNTSVVPNGVANLLLNKLRQTT